MASSSIPSSLNFGSFLPTTNAIDIGQIQSANIDEKTKRILINLYQALNNIAILTNTKESALYYPTEFITGAVYFPTVNQSTQAASTPLNRQVYRTVVNFGPLPNATSKSIPHQLAINSGWIATRIYGAATNSNATSMIPLPYVNLTLNQQVQLDIDPTDVTITTGIDYSDYLTTYIVIEYIKS